METLHVQGSSISLLGLRRQLLQVRHVLERSPRFFTVAFSREGLGCARGRTLIWGKFRRFVLTAVPPLAHHLRARYGLSGGCQNCGASCNLLFRCPHWDESTHLCTVYEDRPNVCRFFPVTPADLRDRDLTRMDVPCGFTFGSTAVGSFSRLRAEAMRTASTNNRSACGISVC
jgi:hypothetical protein